MNGADSLMKALAKEGVEVCFANPGTSEMHLVNALDSQGEIRAILCLFEGVCTGAADGYGRMTGRPALTLLHLGPGLANGIANLHNARRADSPIINLVGDHADYHRQHDSPLNSNITTLASNVSSWIKSDSTATSLSSDAIRALNSAINPKPCPDGRISTLIIPANAAWEEGVEPTENCELRERDRVSKATLEGVAKQIDSECLILLGSDGLSIAARQAAGRISKRTKCRVAMSMFSEKIEHGTGLPISERLPYFPEQVTAFLKGVKKLILAGAAKPVSFFAYPSLPSVPIPEEVEILTLSRSHEDTTYALENIVNFLGLDDEVFTAYKSEKVKLSSSKLSSKTIGEVLASTLPEGAIVCGDSGGGFDAFEPCQNAMPHTWLNLTGGSIGQGGPVSVGAAVACPDRQVVSLLGDGAFMYTMQALWTQAREKLNVTTIIYKNEKYRILEIEYWRLGVNSIGEKASGLFNLGDPSIGYCSLAKGMGVQSISVDTVESFNKALEVAFSITGPYLIEACLEEKEKM